ncbi:hypothetical protein [Streptomyces sp. NPDC017260]|uniref:hypothetical protein n=1 Tax=unclassified Streptomyces TaxID=2593676 RepID=UPI0037AE151E
MGYGFPGDADDFEAELARELNRADPADLSGVVRLVEEFRGRVAARQDPAFGTAVAVAVAEIRLARRAAFVGGGTGLNAAARGVTPPAAPPPKAPPRTRGVP